ncbi:MAG: transcriptional regulator, LysR family [Devosia sp.]|nr:transcriptional regulator, LysR family [Devosia sp.]
MTSAMRFDPSFPSGSGPAAARPDFNDEHSAQLAGQIYGVSRRNLPPLIQLLAFSTAARHLNFTRAAAELSLTQSAVSRQIGALEGMLGVALFQRHIGGVALTPVGEAYLSQVRSGLDTLESATKDLIARERCSDVLTLAIHPTFGTKWLIPRLAQFRKLHPRVTINLVARHYAFDFAATPEIDAAILYGAEDWPGSTVVQMERLMGEHTVVVCAPHALGARQRPMVPNELLGELLLHHSTRPSAWQDWFSGAGVESLSVPAGPQFEHFDMTLQAAKAGLGFAVMPDFLLDGEFSDDRLIIPPGLPRIKSRHDYHFVFPKGRGDRRPVRLFRMWLTEQVRQFVISAL